MKKIKSIEEAFQVAECPQVDFSAFPENKRTYFEGQYNAVVMTEAINDGWVADYSNPNQKKWFPVFRADSSSPSGFVFYSSGYRCSSAYAGDASRLSFESEAASDYAGQKFTEIYAGIIK